MRILKRIIFILGVLSLAILILLSVSFFVLKHLKIKEIVENEIEHSLGIGITINELEFSPLLAHIGLKGITVHNPPGFPEDELAYIESLHFVFDPIEIITRRKPNIYLMALDLKRLNIVKNKEGKINIKELIPVKDETAAAEAKAPFYFDVLILSLGQVTYSDYSGARKKEYKYTIGLKDAAFVGLKDENAVVRMVVYKALENTEIGKLINLTIVPVLSSIEDTVDAAWGTAKIGAKGIWEIGTLPIKLLSGGH
ncbi:AsmA family protein [bacterium]|nr:MAG: AsmA family protein [bacterium]